MTKHSSAKSYWSEPVVVMVSCTKLPMVKLMQPSMTMVCRYWKSSASGLYWTRPTVSVMVPASRKMTQKWSRETRPLRHSSPYLELVLYQRHYHYTRQIPGFYFSSLQPECGASIQTSCSWLSSKNKMLNVEYKCISPGYKISPIWSVLQKSNFCLYYCIIHMLPFYLYYCSNIMLPFA